MKNVLKLSLVFAMAIGLFAGGDRALVEAGSKPSKPVVKTTVQPAPTAKSVVATKPGEYKFDKSMTISGSSVVPKEQAVSFIKHYAPDAKLNTSVDNIVEYYYKEAEKEGIRGDVALAQAIVETGFFRYGATVDYKQNNFCGLGTTSSSVKGAYFKTPEIGVRAHIQHLLVYSSKNTPKEKVVDPRFDLVKGSPRHYATSKTWIDLNGRWAMSPGYGEKILTMHARMLAHDAQKYKVDDKKDKHKGKDKKEVKGEQRKKSLQERIDDILRGA